MSVVIAIIPTSDERPLWVESRQKSILIMNKVANNALSKSPP